jgi:hypothetical protein
MTLENWNPYPGSTGLDRAAEQCGESASMHGSEVNVLPFGRRTLEDAAALARINAPSQVRSPLQQGRDMDVDTRKHE